MAETVEHHLDQSETMLREHQQHMLELSLDQVALLVSTTTEAEFRLMVTFMLEKEGEAIARTLLLTLLDTLMGHLHPVALKQSEAVGRAHHPLAHVVALKEFTQEEWEFIGILQALLKGYHLVNAAIETQHLSVVAGLLAADKAWHVPHALEVWETKLFIAHAQILEEQLITYRRKLLGPFDSDQAAETTE